MIISKLALGSMVRETCCNIYKSLLLSKADYVPQLYRRQSLIDDISQKIAVDAMFPNQFFLNLFTPVGGQVPRPKPPGSARSAGPPIPISSIAALTKDNYSNLPAIIRETNLSNIPTRGSVLMGGARGSPTIEIIPKPQVVINSNSDDGDRRRSHWARAAPTLEELLVEKDDKDEEGKKKILLLYQH